MTVCVGAVGLIRVCEGTVASCGTMGPDATGCEAWLSTELDIDCLIELGAFDIAGWETAPVVASAAGV
jgi:hypothetical protein